tara:strand:+ start:476 stop:718 length:243 start_codon:yes stop_codon:yes gene_type:complete
MSIIVHHGEVSSAVQKETSHFKMIVSCGHHERRDFIVMTLLVDVCAAIEKCYRFPAMVTPMQALEASYVFPSNICPVCHE